MLKIEQAKELIHQQAEEAIGGMFHVFCSEAAIEYLTRTNLFCIGDVQDGVCYIMKT
jgi:hypothetical protein